MVLYFCIIFLGNLTSLNEKTQNYKIVDLVEGYNFYIKIIFIRCRIEELWFFKDVAVANKLGKKKQNRSNCSKSGFTVANRGRTVPCMPCKTGLDLGWTGSQVRGARCLVSKFMDLFDTALQVQVPIVHFTLFQNDIVYHLWSSFPSFVGKPKKET